MFLVFINALIEVLEQYNRKVKLFADDVKLYVWVLNDSDNATVCFKCAVAEWANSWKHIISTEKCCVMSIGNATVWK